MLRQRPSSRTSAFTLIELLVVVAVVALLVAILLPALSIAKRQARSTTCATLLRSAGQASMLYSADHRELVVPSYTMTGVTGDGVDLEGWGPIFDRDGYAAGSGERTLAGSPFVCPEAKDVPGLLTGQTGNDPDNARGWMEWPCRRSGAGFDSVTIPDRGFDRILRVAYWINADNPIGAPASITPDLFFTGSVGYGPGSNGVFIRQTRETAFVRPHTLITFADGVYAGRQRNNRLGDTSCRIGYRHPGGKGLANAAFADGHVQGIEGTAFPRAANGKVNIDEVRLENQNGQPTVYANPERALP